MPRQKPRLTWLAAALLAACLLCVLLALRASDQASGALGPQALAVIGKRVWLADERGLVVLDERGKPLFERSFEELGIASVGSIVAIDDARILLASRGSTTLLVLDAATASKLGETPLRFPPALASQASHTLWLATRRLAAPGKFEIYVATGGNHTVLRFDASGQMLARSKEGLYRFTNGLWLAEDGLWTTDTNTYVLRRLDPETLEQTDSLPLSGLSAQRFLGAAVASRGVENPHDKPALSTLVRLQNGMLVGRVVDVFTDATEADYPLPAQAEPMDLAWLGQELLVVEGASGKVLRFSADRRALGEFGSDPLRLRFNEARRQRDNGHTAYYLWLGLAGLSFIGALLALRRARLATPAEQAQQPGLPVPDRKQVTGLLLRAIWPAPFLLLLAFALQQPAGHALLKRALSSLIDTGGTWLVVSALLSVFLPLFSWVLARLRRLMLDPRMESLYNFEALVWLREARQWRDAMGKAEEPREVVACQSPVGARLLLTNHRLLLFRAGSSEAGAEMDWMRGEIRRLEFDDPEFMGSWRFFWAALRGLPCTLQRKDGGSEVFHLRSLHAARRIQQQLLRSAPAAASAAPAAPHKPRNLAAQILGSALLPGLGQWLQARKGSALLHFTYAGILLAWVVAPIVWALVTRHTDVSLRGLIYAALAWAVLCLSSALEAWSGRPRQRADSA